MYEWYQYEKEIRKIPKKVSKQCDFVDPEFKDTLFEQECRCIFRKGHTSSRHYPLWRTKISKRKFTPKLINLPPKQLPPAQTLTPIANKWWGSE